MSWKPPESLWEWHAPYDPQGGSYSDNIFSSRWARMLLRADPSAFGAVERQLSSTAELAQVTAHGLRGAQGADWEGDAGNAYRAALGKFPTVLDQVHQSYMDALGAFATFSETTFELQRKYRTFQADLSDARSRWESALSATYSDAQTGWARIHHLKDELTTICARGHSILNASDQALTDLQNRLSPLIADAPHVHESNWQKVLHPFKVFLGQITGTWKAFQEFSDHPGWKTLGDLTEDLAVDASVVVLAAGASEGLAGLGIIDAGADSALLTATEYGAAAARGASVAATGLNVTSHEFDGDYGTGTLEALTLLVPSAKEAFGTSELEKTIGEAKLVAYYKAERAAGETPEQALAKLDPDEAKALKAIVPKYEDPAAVRAATRHIASELQAVRKEAGLVEAPEHFVWENGVLVPAHQGRGPGARRGPPASSHTELSEEAVMSRFVVNSHSLRALQQAVLGLATELENGSQAMGPYGYSSRPDPATNYSAEIANYGVLNGGDEALGAFFDAWQQSLAVTGKNIETLSKQLGSAADSYEAAEQTQVSLNELFQSMLNPKPSPPPPKGLGGLITGG